MNRRNTFKQIGTFMVFGAPATVMFFAVIIIPFLVGLVLTLTNWDVRTQDSTFVGLSNYISVFNDKVFLTQLWFTIKYVFFTVLIANAFAFIIALILTSGLKGEKWIRTGFFTPNLIGGIVLGYLWATLFSQVFPYLGKKYGWA